MKTLTKQKNIKKNNKKRKVKNEIIKKEVKQIEIVDPVKRKEIVTNLVLNGDISKMDNIQRVDYYIQLCNSLGLNSLTKPFDILILKGKTVLYPNKNCAEQLREKDGVSIYKTEDKIENNIYSYKAYARNKYGILDEARAFIPLVKEENGKIIPCTLQAQADLMMKCETKAKRRVTFSICGLGMPEDPEEQERYYNEEKKEENILKDVSESIKKEIIEDKFIEIESKKKSEPETKKINNNPNKTKLENKKEEFNIEKAIKEILDMARPYQNYLTEQQINFFRDLKNKKTYSQDEYVRDNKYVSVLIETIKKEHN